MKNYKIAVAGTGYVGLSLGVLFAQHHQVVAVDIVQAKVDMINNKKSPIQDEKLQWLKFNYRFPLQSIVSDKLLVRDYVKEKIGEEYLIPLLGSWEEYSDIDFSSLPKRFVLKCNHDSGGLVVCTDKDKLNYEEAKKKIEKSDECRMVEGSRHPCCKDDVPDWCGSGRDTDARRHCGLGCSWQRGYCGRCCVPWYQPCRPAGTGERR